MTFHAKTLATPQPSANKSHAASCWLIHSAASHFSSLLYACVAFRLATVHHGTRCRIYILSFQNVYKFPGRRHGIWLTLLKSNGLSLSTHTFILWALGTLNPVCFLFAGDLSANITQLLMMRQKHELVPVQVSLLYCNYGMRSPISLNTSVTSQLPAELLLTQLRGFHWFMERHLTGTEKSFYSLTVSHALLARSRTVIVAFCCSVNAL